MTELRFALERNQDEIRVALKEAAAELEHLEQRRAELHQLMSRAKAVLGEEESTDDRHDLTLHEALGVVLSDLGDEWMSVADLAAEVNRRNLYRMKDGRPVEASQIHARIKNYGQMFEKIRSKVRLRYLFSTSLRQPRGSYWAAQTIVRRISDGAVMAVETRVSYSVRPPSNESMEHYVLARAEHRARRLISRGAFEPEGHDIALISSTGRQQIQSSQDAGGG